MDKNFIPDLIFDIGLHKGADANFYLRKGFRVIGLEARQDLCEYSRNLNAQHADKLIIIQKALFRRSGETVTFFVNDEKDDWGSLFREGAEKGIGSAREINVETITLEDLFEYHGIPYYIKCDIEGADAIFVELLLKSSSRPPFVSIEATDVSDLANLQAAGYNRFQIVNQYLNPFTTPPNPAREGQYVDATFSHETSGLFGLELPPEKWYPFRQTTELFLDWYRLRDRDPSLGIGWLDIHARLD